eukprot:gene20503-22520_t
MGFTVLRIRYIKRLTTTMLGGPLELKVGLHFVKLDEISTKKQSYEADMYMWMLWKDIRLCHNETEDIVISGDPHKNIWRPDLYFENALKTDKSEITKYNYYIRIQKDGSIYSSLRASVVGKCPKNVMYFPFDSQHCEMFIQSYGYPKNKLNLKWHDPVPVSIKSRKLQQFQISRIKIEEDHITYTVGDFSRLKVHFYLERHLGYYIVQIYIPCHLVVMLSWLSFFMSPEDVGDRIGLGITCLLTLVFLMTSINESLPKVSYAKTIDFYLIGCFMYVLTVVIETVIAKQLSNKGDKKANKKEWEEVASRRICTCEKRCEKKPTVTTIQNLAAMTTNLEMFGQNDNHSISTTSSANMELGSRHDNAIGNKEIATQQQKSAVKKLTSAKRLDNSEEEKHVSKSIEKLLANDHSVVRPNITGGPLQLEVGLHFIKFDEISTKKQSYESDVYLRMLWKDTRLCHNETEDIIISGNPHKSIWSPDLYFENALKTAKSEITKYNYYIRIQKDGNIYSSIRAKVVGKCPQNVIYFPFDSQNCEMVIESYGYPKNHLNLKWHQPSPVFIKNKKLQQFQIIKVKLEKSKATYTSGDFSQLKVHFYLERHLGYYIVQIYIPCHLVVILSWLSLFMSPEDVGDRIGLGITCLLTLVFLMTSINESLPKVSYTKTIDFYLIGCFMYVLSVAIETVIAKKLSGKEEQGTEEKEGQFCIRAFTCNKCYGDKSTVTPIQNATMMATNFEIFQQADCYSASTTNTAKRVLDNPTAKKEEIIAQQQQQQQQQQETTAKKLTPAKRLDRYCRILSLKYRSNEFLLQPLKKFQQDVIDNTFLQKHLSDKEKLLKVIEFRTSIFAFEILRAGGPLALEVGLHFIKFDEISTKKQSYESDVFLVMMWKDTRWCHNERVDIIISGEPHPNIWRPDLFFENALKTDKSEITKYNSQIRIQKDGSMYSSIRASVVGKCPQNVLYFPFDSQHCKMVIESYGYPKNHLNLKWHHPSPVVIKIRKLQQFQIIKIKLEKSQATYISGDYSQLIVHFYLERHLGYYIIQIYIPCHLVVMLSWLSLFMSPEDVGDRIALGITCLLTLVFLMTSINESLPKVSYAKTIDFYLIGCFMYVLSVAIETVIAKRLSGKGEQRTEEKEGQFCSRTFTCNKCCGDKSTVTPIQNPTVITTNFEILQQADCYSASTTSTANRVLDNPTAKKEEIIAQQQQQQQQQQETTAKKLTPAKRLDKYCREKPFFKKQSDCLRGATFVKGFDSIKKNDENNINGSYSGYGFCLLTALRYLDRKDIDKRVGEPLLTADSTQTDAKPGNSENKFFFISPEEQHISNSIKKLLTNDHSFTRPNITGGPLELQVVLYFIKLDEISTRKQSYESDVYLRMMWKDTRWCHNETEDIVISGDPHKNIWRPDLFFENALKTDKSEITKYNYFMRIRKDGNMVSSIRASVVGKCPQNVIYFPFDSQLCEMVIESYAYKKNQLNLTWHKQSPVFIQNRELQQFKISKIKLEKGQARYVSDDFSRLKVKFYLDRHLGYYIIQIYVPLHLVVMLSWLPFWMSPEDVGDRIGLGITCLLTLVFLMTSINESLPKVSYAKTIDFYLIGCFIYVLSVAIETVIAKKLSGKGEEEDGEVEEGEGEEQVGNSRNYTSSKHYRDTSTVTRVRKPTVTTTNLEILEQADCYSTSTTTTANMGLGSRHGYATAKKKKIIEQQQQQETTAEKVTPGKRLDRYCRVIYPALFLILNLVYFIICVRNGKNVD